MFKSKEPKKDFWIRLILKKGEKLYRVFEEIKNYLGMKINVEIVRFCIKKTYDMLLAEGKIDSDAAIF